MTGFDPEAEREWRALELLAEHAPGLAPEPLAYEPAAGAPVIRMSRLPGAPLLGQPLDEAAVHALTAAVRALHSALPPPVLAAVPRRPVLVRALRARIRSWTPLVRVPANGQTRAALDLGLRWLAGSDLDEAAPDVPQVFGTGDGNLANYLWDGSDVRIVDFEDSGRSDRAFELAEITEHVGSWIDGPLDVAAFLRGFALTAAEAARLRKCRRLLALVWLFLLCLDETREQPRNPPGTARRQARRLRALLD
ncbi:phosphotransferase family protein [Streptomyces marispadix]|uniref:Aminoglycoside phosphotransferase family protein n=1 Tax=Streptomyces marispadix TaxID=2922868 RepID=A0ABS9SV87_9ACTN|nr:aminoglycoside phosphotransferase family protein [Streptomyces marispadix]MCH6160188.1 aminoglycoside phosphotransferase family protein [Streptomyces marispadix]